MNFRPNVVAKILHAGLSGTVGPHSNDSFGRFTMPIMEGPEGVLSDAGIGVFMGNATDDAERECEHLDQRMAKQIDGTVATSRPADRRPLVDLAGPGRRHGDARQPRNCLRPPTADRPDAIFCGNDQIARVCADTLREAGLRVPQDIALVGFDDWGVMTDACRCHRWI